MPVYAYQVRNAVTGEILGTIDLPLSVDDRDAVELVRETAPRSIAIAGAAADPSLPQNQVMRAYQRIESRHGNNAEFRRRIGHSPEAVKRAWAT